jgi:phosphoribosylformylglycinamidine synthase subunit PurSL
LIEVTPTCWDEVIEVFRGLPLGRLGRVTGVAGNGKGDSPRLTVHGLDHRVVIDAAVADLKTVWQRPLAWS